MSADKQREIARKGGRAAHEKGTAHEFTTDEARAAGRTGGERVSANREHMSRIGRLGGKSSAGRRAASAQPATTESDTSHPGMATASEEADRSDDRAGDMTPGRPAM